MRKGGEFAAREAAIEFVVQNRVTDKGEVRSVSDGWVWWVGDDRDVLETINSRQRYNSKLRILLSFSKDGSERTWNIQKISLVIWTGENK